MAGARGLHGPPTSLVAKGVTVPFAEGVQRLRELELHAAVVEQAGEARVELEVRNPRREPIVLDRLGVRFDARPALVLEQGYQSWSVVRRSRTDDVRPERAEQPGWLRAMYLADPDAAGTCVDGDQFLVTDAGVVGFLDGRRHLGTVRADASGVTAWALLDAVALDPGETRVLDPIWWAAGDPGSLYSTFAERWAEEAGARVGDPPPPGWCSWYHYFGQVTPADVRANLELAARHGLGLVQIDDGYQAAVGDWLEAADPWQEGTAALAREITTAGLTAGIWTAPFLAAEGSALAREHPEWLARDERGDPLRAMFNPLAWGGWALALDTTNPAVGDHLRSVFASLRAQGFRYHKTDFCFAAAVPATRSRAGMTRAEALRAGLQAVRDGIGDDGFLLGCGCPFGPAVGVLDAMRVSPDVAPYWTSALSFPGFEECSQQRSTQCAPTCCARRCTVGCSSTIRTACCCVRRTHGLTRANGTCSRRSSPVPLVPPSSRTTSRCISRANGTSWRR
jgi:alpha-galactosidase